MIELASLVECLRSGGYTCVVQNGADCRCFKRRGVADLYDLWKDEPSFLRGASVADKVVGRGAAALMIAGGVVELHTEIISASALLLLREAGVRVEYGSEVEHICNREGTGWCPIEWMCRDQERVDQMLPLIEEFVCRMRSMAKGNG